MKTGLLITWLIMTAIFIVCALTMKRKVKRGMEDWIKINNLNYKKEVSINNFINSAFLNSEAVTFTNVVWGLYKNKRIYMYTVMDSSGITLEKRTFFNGSFYSKIKVQDIDHLLENENYLPKIGYIFGNCIEIEIPQFVAAYTFLLSEKVVEYTTVARIYAQIEKFAKSKVDFKDKFISIFLGNSWQIDMKFNDPEVIDFVSKNYTKVDKETIRQVADAFEAFSCNYGIQIKKSDDSLENIDMNKFR
jgi:hypothetical protein